MVQTKNPFFDEVARLVTDAAGVAHGMRREVETMTRAQIERLLSHMDVVTREEFEAVRDMAIAARDENARLAAQVAKLEAAAAGKSADPEPNETPII